MFKDKSLKLLLEFFKNNSPCAIAVSGGADSGALLAFGAKTGASVGAYTVISALTPSAEKEKSGKLCEILGVPHKFITVQDSSLSEVFKNLPERCYECKKKIFSLIREKAFSDGYVSVAEGSNADDLDDYRPGMRALKELGIKSPLLEAGIFKKSVYAALRAERLDEFCDPPGACLATRFPCGTGFTKEDLVRTDAAENFLKKYYYGGLIRVRNMKGKAVIETDAAGKKIFRTEMESINEKFIRLGYSNAVIDEKGYRTGSMNRTGK